MKIAYDSVRRCDACGCDLTGIFSKHFFGEWGMNPHCLPCGKKCDRDGVRDPHEHGVSGLSGQVPEPGEAK